MHCTAQLLAPLAAVFRIHLFRIARAGDDFLDGAEGVAVGGQKPQIVTAGDAAPVVDPVIAWFCRFSPRVAESHG